MLSSRKLIGRAVTVAIGLPFLLALAPPSASDMRSAIAPLTPLSAGETATLTGRTDGVMVSAVVTLSSKDSALSGISITQDGQALRLPVSALEGVKGARHTWLEERGALTTLVIEGVDDQQDWRLALEFHDEQLWLRRLSLRGHSRDAFIYYSRKDMVPTPVKMRHTLSRSFHD